MRLSEGVNRTRWLTVVGLPHQLHQLLQGRDPLLHQVEKLIASHVDRRDRVQLVEEGDCCLASRILRSCQTAGKDVPAGTMAMVSSSDFVRVSERPTAISTLNRQRHLTPSCGGFTPTAERTVGPARISLESLTPRPGIRERGARVPIYPSLNIWFFWPRGGNYAVAHLVVNGICPVRLSEGVNRTRWLTVVGLPHQLHQLLQGRDPLLHQVEKLIASHVDRRDRVQLVEEGDCCLASRILRSCQTAGKDVPAGTMAMVSSSDFVRVSERPTAISTLNRQRHLTPSCGGFTPTAERTVGPARISLESLTPRPGIREHNRRKADEVDGSRSRHLGAKV